MQRKKTVTTFQNERPKKEDDKAIFYWKYINFIYSADLTFWVIRKMDFNRAEPTFSLHKFGLTKWSLFVHSNAPYVHPRLDSVLQLCWAFQIKYIPSCQLVSLQNSIYNMDSQTEMKIVWLQISWLLKKPTDLEPHCFLNRIFIGSVFPTWLNYCWLGL